MQSVNGGRITRIQYLKYLLMRRMELSHVQQCGKLTLEFYCDAWASHEASLMEFHSRPAQQSLYRSASRSVLIDQLRLRDANNVPLGRRQDGLYKVDGQPDGTDIPAGNTLPKLIPQALEGSNVSAIEAMTRLIDQSRAFSSHLPKEPSLVCSGVQSICWFSSSMRSRNLVVSTNQDETAL